MYLLIDCSNCRTPLQLPPGAKSIRCAICRAVTRVAEPRALGHNNHHHHHAQPPSASVAPSPYNQAPGGAPPSVHGRKRALICGVSYKNTRHELKGCINDAKCMKYLLNNKFNFPESSILVLTGNFFLHFKNIYILFTHFDFSVKLIFIYLREILIMTWAIWYIYIYICIYTHTHTQTSLDVRHVPVSNVISNKSFFKREVLYVVVI